MYVRKKKNKSGSVSVQIIDKKAGYRVVETIGSAKGEEEIGRLYQEGLRKIHSGHPGQQWLFPCKSPDELVIERFVKNLSNAHIRTIGPELIFGILFDRIGFNVIEDKMFRHLTIARLAYPVSKLKTADYLERYRGIKVEVGSIYRFMDRLKDRHKGEVEKIAYNYTQNSLGQICVVFYDITTLYFEAEDEDDLRKRGFSKDGKFEKPQILLGLLAGERGLPIGYDIFEGNTFEGDTLIPVLGKIQDKYGFKKPVVIADAALLSKKNLEHLTEEGYKFIIGARIKNESKEIKEEILQKARDMEDGDSFVIKKQDGTRLAVTYSSKRAAKDAYNRHRGIRKLRKQVRSGRLTKQNVNRRGYNKFLTMTGETKITIDEERIEADKLWDGLKGFVTSTRLSAKRVADNYVQLWQIERAFRISKTDLKVRPIHHHIRNRIEAHISIAFAAYTIYKELEYLFKKRGVNMSPKRAAELTHNMYELRYSIPGLSQERKQLLQMSEEQKILYNAIYK